MLTLWFNRTYATHAHLFALLRDNPDGTPVRIVATHADAHSPVQVAADVDRPEPSADLTPEQYVAWALDFCAEHHVDVFVPRLHQEAVAVSRAAFEDAGVSVLVGPPEAIRLLGDKARAYDDASAAGLAVPPFHVVRTGAQLLAAHEDLAGFGDVCVKPVTGVGGLGYRRLTTGRLRLADVLVPPGHEVGLPELARAIDDRTDEGGVVPELMVLPYLPGPEVSVDCLADADGELVAAVPRTKAGRVRTLADDPRAIDMARTVVGRHRLESLSNTQVRYWCRPGVDDAARPYLLETNTRAAAGLYQTALSGVNLAWAAVRMARGLPPGIGEPRLGARYTTMSSLVPLDD